MLSSLSFVLLGQVELLKNREPLSHFRSQKEIALVVYLAHTAQPHQRDFLSDLLWKSRTTKQSRSNLRTALARLRKKLGDALIITRQTVELSPESLEEVDSVRLLQALAAMGQVDSAEEAITLQNILDSYRGDFLADFQLPDAPRFEQWMLATREHIRRQVINGYHKLGQYASTTGETEIGIVAARQWLSVDALDEMAHTLLIRLLIEAGNETEAIAHYNYCVELLRTELAVAPPAKMTELIQHVQFRRPPIPRPAAASPHNLPPAYNQFFGRKATQEEIHSRLDQPWCRLVTIVGQGGVGKTRLATTIARTRLGQYQDGVWLVRLAELDPDDADLAEAIAVEIATVLDFRLSGAATPLDQLLDYLQHKQMLLVLDNFEHLLAGTQTVQQIAQRCEQVQMVVTSREVLQLQAEWAIGLTGLAYPTSETDEVVSEAVDLFAARRAQQQWGPISEDELRAIRTICRMVEGLPLALELAAALTHSATCQSIAERLQHGFGALATSMRDVVPRHHSLRIVFEMSWRTLTPDLKERLARLSVFHGGFTAAAAQEIAGATPQQLAALVNKSLVAFDAKIGRYSLHATIQENAAEKLEAADPTAEKHTRYYLTLLAQHTEPLQKEKPQRSIERIRPEIDNVRRAWYRGVEARQADLLFEALTPLSIYYQLRSLSHEGEAVMDMTLQAARTWGASGIGLAARAGVERARFQNRLGRFREAAQTLKAALKLAAQGGDRWAEGMGHVWWGESLWRVGRYKSSEDKLNRALAIGREIQSTFIIGWCHHQLGIINEIRGRFDVALDHLEQACAAWRALANTNLLSVSLNSIGLVYRNRGDFTAAKRTMEQALAICTEQDNRYLQSMLLNNLSILYVEQHDYSGAQYYLQLGLELAKASGSLVTQSDIYINMGKNYRLQGDWNLAGQYSERGLEIANKIGNSPSIVDALGDLAAVKKIQGDILGAEVLYHQALTLARRASLRSLECEILMGLAELYNEIDFVQAKEYSAQVLALAKDIGHPTMLKRAEEVNNSLSLK